MFSSLLLYNEAEGDDKTMRRDYFGSKNMKDKMTKLLGAEICLREKSLNQMKNE